MKLRTLQGMANWEEGAKTWDQIITSPDSPHFFYYRSADFFIQENIENRNMVLELGCGTGQCLLGLDVSRIGQIVESDYSRSMIMAAKRKIKKSGIGDKVHFLRLDAQKIPLRGESFDMVFSRGVLLSYVDDPNTLLEECYGILKRGGVILMDSMNLPKNSAKATFRKLMISEGKGYYQEFFTKGRYQHASSYELDRKGSILKKYSNTDKIVILRQRPENLEKETVRMMKERTRLFTPRQVRKMFQRKGFIEVSTFPLGHMAMIARNKKIRNEMIRNRDLVCMIQKEISRYLKSETGIHLITLAKKPQ